MKLATSLVHAGSRRIEGAVVMPIFRSANYLQDGAGEYADVRYLRLSNGPQHVALHERLAAIEGAEQALAFASGMAAISTSLLAILSAGDHLLVQANVYGGTATFLHDLERWGIRHTSVDATDPASWEAALTPTTRAFYVEAVSNPLMDVPDLPAVARFAREHGLVSLIDNTFLSPVQYRPIEHGFDLVLHSATKFLAGHSDLVAGVVAGSAAHVDRIRHQQNHLGGSLDPDAAFLLDRGLKTLHLRVPWQAGSALRLATTLSAHPEVVRVRYPGLPTDPNHARASAFTGYGGMLAFETRTPAAAERVLERLTIPLDAASLGGVESLVVRPSHSSHLGMPAAEREALGITDALIRVSVGVEDPGDLEADFLAALDRS
ncbi:MAG: aminotransferase class I/II-fold pyridoxal phosphate-dependent enzyme [Myxococcota bacterium]